VVDCKAILREVCAKHYLSSPLIISGTGHTVEIDEAMFVRRKANVGQVVRQQWVFGRIDVQTKQCFLVAVNQRDAQTLITVLQQYVAPNTAVVSDLWCAYNIIDVLNVNQVVKLCFNTNCLGGRAWKYMVSGSAINQI
jgi:hypothetical protein